MDYAGMAKRAFSEARTYVTIAVSAFLASQTVPDEVRVQATAAMVAIGTATYVVAYIFGAMDATKDEAEHVSAAVEDERRNTRAFERGLEHRTAQLEESRRVASGLAAELEASRRMASELESRLEDSMALISELEGESARLAELEAQLAELRSDDHRRREVFDTLDERERWCLAHVLHVVPRAFSVASDVLWPSFATLVREGVVFEAGRESQPDGRERRSYVVSPEWRPWLASHADELPDPASDMPA